MTCSISLCGCYSYPCNGVVALIWTNQICFFIDGSFQNGLNPRWRRITAVAYRIFSHAISVVFGQHHRAWWDIILDGPISQGKQVVWFLCCDVQQLGFPCHLFPESPRHISSVWNGTFSLGSQDLIKQRCCLNSHVNLLTLRYSASPLFIVTDVPQLCCCYCCWVF